MTPPALGAAGLSVGMRKGTPQTSAWVRQFSQPSMGWTTCQWLTQVATVT